MNKHDNFILTPIEEILEEGARNIAIMGGEINVYPLYEYLLQSMFLKMSGAQEQKLKCILWSLADDDYDFRYSFLKGSYGECSNYKDKSKVFTDLIDALKRKGLTLEDISSLIEHNKISQEVIEKLDALLAKGDYKYPHKNFKLNLEEVIYKENEKQKYFFQKNKKSIDLLNNNEGHNVLYTAYELLYNHRNRLAHNVFAYHKNTYTLTNVTRENYLYDNYYTRFFLLILIDKLFLTLYGEYKKIRVSKPVF